MNIWLLMQSMDGSQRQFPIRKDRTIIGRETTCDLRVPIPSVSMRHCQISLDGESIKLTDLNSERGTYHNGNRVNEAVLSPFDKVTVGPVTFVVRMQTSDQPGQGASPEVVIERSTIESASLPLNGLTPSIQPASASADADDFAG